jgi:hypothetical protein
MNKTTTPGVEPEDHREQVDWVAISKHHGTRRRLHRVDEDPAPDDLENGAQCTVACETTLTDADSYWQAKPAGVYPPGYHPLCQAPACFGDVDGQ